jgi:GrpB-like predicted nucleotidyltransferase (UPF0157 family)
LTEDPAVSNLRKESVRNILAEYDSHWPIAYAQEEDRILAAVGDKVVAIEHIGSTSVPKLRSKPIIDILVGVRRLADVKSCIEPLQRLGYEYRPENRKLIPNTEYFRKGPSGANSHHLRIVQAESDLWRQYILFRDYLRSHAAEAQLYERLKIEAYEKHGRYPPLEAKKNFIDTIVARAKSEQNSSAH